MLTTGNQLKAARMLAEMDQLPLAEQAGVSIGTIRNMEGLGSAPLRSSLATIRAVMAPLEAAGIEFLNHGQPGVRLRKAEDRMGKMKVGDPVRRRDDHEPGTVVSGPDGEPQTPHMAGMVWVEFSNGTRLVAEGTIEPAL